MLSETEKMPEASPSERKLCQSQTCGPQTNGTVLEAMRAKLLQRPRRYHSEPFCVMDIGYVYKEYQRWTNLLPDVKPFYGWSSQKVSLIIIFSFVT